MDKQIWYKIVICDKYGKLTTKQGHQAVSLQDIIDAAKHLQHEIRYHGKAIRLKLTNPSNGKAINNANGQIPSMAEIVDFWG